MKSAGTVEVFQVSSSPSVGMQGECWVVSVYPQSSVQVFTAQAMARTKKQAVNKSPATNVDQKGHVDGCDLSGIARDWDQDTELKDRLLEGDAVLDTLQQSLRLKTTKLARSTTFC